MTSTLDSVSKPDDRPAIITICGDGGLGKTTLASLWPKPIVVRAEDGLQAIPKAKRPKAFPILDNVNDLWDQLLDLIEVDHDYKTLIVDTVTSLERLFIQDVMENDKKNPKSLNQALGGYGNGAGAVAAMHQRVRKAAGILNEKKNMHIVFTAHTDTETLELPDQEPYTRYSLRLAKKSVAPYTDDVDLVGFMKLETFVKSSDTGKNKAISDGNRLLVTYVTAANVSKNRYGITKDLTCKMGENPLASYIPYL